MESMITRIARAGVWLVAAAALPTAAYARSAVEGKVALPPAQHESRDAAGERYQIDMTRPPLPPDEPAAVVYLEGEFSDTPPPAAESAKVLMVQQGYQFRPGLLAVRRGTRVAFPNLDEDYHNILSYSKPKRFDLGRYRGDTDPPEVLFDTAGVVKTYCEIHEHMRGAILVLDTPYFTKTDPGGLYRLEGLPPGRHVLKAWISEDQVAQKTVELKPDETLKVDFP
jgi:plastocyanin